MQFCSKGITWNDILQLPSGNPNLYFQLFFCKAKSLLDTSALLKAHQKGNLKNQNSKLCQHYCNFIRIKNSLYKQFCKITISDRKKHHKRFINYRNLRTTLTKTSKEQYKSFIRKIKRMGGYLINN